MTSVPIPGTIEPNMGTQAQDISTASVLFGKARREILAILFCHSDQEFYLRQIVRAAGVGQGAVQRDLASLTAAGIVVRTRRGHQVFYRANSESPVFPELRGLIVKTAGVADVLRAALADLSDRIVASFIYGSMARGTEKTSSDLDLMVIGDVEFGEVVSALRLAQDQLAREINPSVFHSDEMRQRIAEEDHFITTVLREEKVFLIGDEHDLRQLV